MIFIFLCLSPTVDKSRISSNNRLIVPQHAVVFFFFIGLACQFQIISDVNTIWLVASQWGCQIHEMDITDRGRRDMCIFQVSIYIFSYKKAYMPGLTTEYCVKLYFTIGFKIQEIHHLRHSAFFSSTTRYIYIYKFNLNKFLYIYNFVLLILGSCLYARTLEFFWLSVN